MSKKKTFERAMSHGQRMVALLLTKAGMMQRGESVEHTIATLNYNRNKRRNAPKTAQ